MSSVRGKGYLFFYGLGVEAPIVDAHPHRAVLLLHKQKVLPMATCFGE